jgi:transcriptional regulator with XRE-family HTH domain
MDQRPSTFGKMLQQVLRQRGISQAELARLAGFHPSHISRYAAGRTSPQPRNLNRILKALGIEQPELIAVAAGWDPKLLEEVTFDLMQMRGLVMRLLHDSIDVMPTSHREAFRTCALEVIEAIERNIASLKGPNELP